MTVDKSILQAFVKLGNFLVDFCDNNGQKNTEWSKKLKDSITRAEQENSWFTQENIFFSLKHWGELLIEKKLEEWTSSYSFNSDKPIKTIAIIMAGNIPLVGLHDLICVLLTGNHALVKLSSNAKILLPFIANFLVDVSHVFKNRITFTQQKLQDFDAVIATGSNNTGRYFDYYFGKYPNIIRKNRNSIAILSGKETKEELSLLGEDIFRYFGLGCRSVSKLYVPKEYDFKHFFEALFLYDAMVNTHKYHNNYDYNKAVYLMSDFKLLDNNFLLLKEDESFGSPIGTLNYEYYSDIETLHNTLEANKEQLQCVVSNGFINNSITIGTTQKPSLKDYADDLDTVQFLLDL